MDDPNSTLCRPLQTSLLVIAFSISLVLGAIYWLTLGFEMGGSSLWSLFVVMPGVGWPFVLPVVLDASVKVNEQKTIKVIESLVFAAFFGGLVGLIGSVFVMQPVFLIAKWFGIDLD